VRIKVKLDRGTGPEVIVIGPVGIIAWERRTKQKMSSLQDGTGMDDMAFMAYSELRARGMEETYEDFVASLVDLEPTDDDRPPSQPDQGPSSG
jgi:hypothetical protein